MIILSLITLKRNNPDEDNEQFSPFGAAPRLAAE
jgi:hypothetical protein